MTNRAKPSKTQAGSLALTVALLWLCPSGCAEMTEDDTTTARKLPDVRAKADQAWTASDTITLS